jgi:hypothetical protein
MRADERDEKHPLPIVIVEDDQKWDFSHVEDNDKRISLMKWKAMMESGRPFFEYGKDGNYGFQNLHNVNVSQCFNCNAISVWIFDRIVQSEGKPRPPTQICLKTFVATTMKQAQY